MQHPRQVAGQHDGRPPGIAQAPHATAQIIDAVAAFDAEREAHLLAQPVLVQGQRRTIGFLVGAEGPGLRERTRETCDRILRIPFAADFGSLNVSNAAAVALYAASQV